jgi:hypothetical protein
LFAVKNVNRLVALQVNQDSPIGATPPESKLVHAKNVGYRCSDLLSSLLSDEGVGAGDIAKKLTDSGCCFSATGKGKLKKGLAQPLGRSGVTCQHTRKRFGENTTQALSIATEELTGMNHQLDRPGTPGQIPGLAPVVAVDPAAPGATIGTGDRFPYGLKMNKDPVMQ